MTDLIPAAAEAFETGRLDPAHVPGRSPLNRLAACAAATGIALASMPCFPDLAALETTASAMGALSARIAGACQELSGWISDQAAAGKLSPGGTASHAWNQIEAAADAATQMNRAFCLAGVAFRELAPECGGISFDCGNGLHAPVCPGCSCDCHG